MLEKLSKRKKGVYGPDGGLKGTFLIDDITAPEPDQFNDITMHEQMIELLDTSKWLVYIRNCKLLIFTSKLRV